MTVVENTKKKVANNIDAEKTAELISLEIDKIEFPSNLNEIQILTLKIAILKVSQKAFKISKEVTLSLL